MILKSEADTKTLAKNFAVIIKPPLLIYLVGEIGSGKTFFVRALLQAMGFKGAVKSPTYSLLETYSFDTYVINHFDLYRFSHALEWYDLGFDQIANHHSINLIEWPEKISSITLNPDIILNITYNGPARCLDIKSNTEIGRRLVKRWIIS